jgi:hypothetical protein
MMTTLLDGIDVTHLVAQELNKKLKHKILIRILFFMTIIFKFIVGQKKVL